jgi:hypothetical protein
MATDCYSCEQLLAGENKGIICILKRNRKYLIGFLAGAVTLFVVIKLTHRNGGRK